MPTFRSQGRVTKKTGARKTPSLVCSIEEIRELLGGVSRAAAYEVARRIGRRVGGKRGRLIVSRQALESWLNGEGVR